MTGSAASGPAAAGLSPSAAPVTAGRREPLALGLLRRFCAANGLAVVAEPDFGYAGYIEAGNGRRHFFKGAGFDLNGAGASAIARDKGYSTSFLAGAGLQVPRSLLISTPRYLADIRIKNPAVAARLSGPAEALAFAASVGYPVFLKPNEESEGRGVLRAADALQLSAALDQLGPAYDRLLLQEEAQGRDYRILMLDGACLAVFERWPFRVTGDGRQTLRDLIEQETARFAADGKGRKILPDDPRILTHLAAAGLHLDSVPPAGQAVALLPNSNLSSGGTARDVTARIAPDLVRIAAEAGRTIGLRFFGLDLIAPDIASAEGYRILELNAAPGLSHFHRLGPSEAATVEEIYARVFAAIARDLMA
ncbi:ATP-dependent carboxylate-amine ligase [Pannonibacter tanglangensis]|uniref:ATP-dependent carboxylate-amine ligase n=1 Tax=Pannonibacter tanglangensis TaxID=2750084 RepID=UPI0015D14263|nr:ATP-dependent carboxylate-amine ligase [Pannonibacter sp. XCT-53]